ncbi:uncharacterized protein SPAPADRAFT_50395 [Spathaspora passalidarum NRRL Y-27907]|uniref:Uncharacterized protein n=1 Tax=Spathaspora passalidarum (strain NRRL Y-27907 / 11-Y1) TaxID=619300 RepID=G3AMS7_SPAPN|nr:uncharacterized protein SPAPADRAFT_50395 [Spathaspora passalidarum NRRL Y-27907]EGW33521.1 hypothetical protein SPAPADRAFT_50395 [Spathaspora passalidarum NRRL Y-27907]
MANLDESTEEINRRFGIPNLNNRKSTFPDLTLASLSDEDIDFDKDLGLNSSGILDSNTRNNSPKKSNMRNYGSPPKRVSNDYQDHMYRMRSNPSSPIKHKKTPNRRNLFYEDLNEPTENFEFAGTHAEVGDIGAKKIKAAIDGLSSRKPDQDVNYRDLYNDAHKLSTQLVVKSAGLEKENARLRDIERKNNQTIAELQNWVTSLQEKTKKYKQLYLKAKKKLDEVDQERTEEVVEKVNIPSQPQQERPSSRTKESVGVPLDEVKSLLENLNGSIEKLINKDNTEPKPTVDEKIIHDICEELVRKVKHGLDATPTDPEPPVQYFSTQPRPAFTSTQVPNPPPTNPPSTTYVPYAPIPEPFVAPAATTPSTAAAAPPPPTTNVPVPAPAPSSSPSPAPVSTHAPVQSTQPDAEAPKSTPEEPPITHAQLKELINALTNQKLADPVDEKDPHIYVDCRLCFNAKDKSNIKDGICKRCTKEVMSCDTTLNKLGGGWLPQ